MATGISVASEEYVDLREIAVTFDTEVRYPSGQSQEDPLLNSQFVQGIQHLHRRRLLCNRPS